MQQQQRIKMTTTIIIQVRLLFLGMTGVIGGRGGISSIGGGMGVPESCVIKMLLDVDKIKMDLMDY